MPRYSRRTQYQWEIPKSHDFRSQTKPLEIKILFTVPVLTNVTVILNLVNIVLTNFQNPLTKQGKTIRWHIEKPT